MMRYILLIAVAVMLCGCGRPEVAPGQLWRLTQNDDDPWGDTNMIAEVLRVKDGWALVKCGRAMTSVPLGAVRCHELVYDPKIRHEGAE
jgi:hypothetical protein